VESLLKPIDLPGLHLPGNIFLAPMAGYTDAAFRSLCTEQGASLCFTEMVSAEALARGSSKTLELARRAENERLWGVQIFGADPRSAAAAVRALERLGPSLYDLNCGCSVPKVLKTGAGAALLRDPERIRDMLKAMRGETGAPLSVKIRSGWDPGSLNYLEVAGLAHEGGAALICLHPRTRTQAFSGCADWSHIGELKRRSGLQVFGSGDLFSADDAVRLVSLTGCDGVMFARGAIGNPFIFAQALALFSGRPVLPAPAPEVRLAMALEQLARAVAIHGETQACRQMRKHFCYYSRGIPGGAELRAKAVRAESVKDYRRLVEQFLKR
jgi:nifR3 family TIM-barrel protein